MNRLIYDDNDIPIITFVQVLIKKLVNFCY